MPDALEPHALFSTGDPASAERLGSPFLGRHRLTARDDASTFQATLHAVVTGPVTLGYLHFASATDIDLTASAPRFLVIEAMAGRTAVTCGPRSFEVTPGRAVVVQPGRPAMMRCPAGVAHLVIGIEQQPVLVHLTRLLGRALDRPLDIHPELDLGAGASSRWNLAVEVLQAELSESGSLLRAGIGNGQLEEFLMSSLLYAQPSSHSELLSQPSPGAEGRATSTAKHFIEANLSERLTLNGVAAAAGVSVRTLQAAFRAELRTTPTAYIRGRRLDRARSDLADEGATSTVTDVATRWGITHLGRFAAEYRVRFGESPSTTLRGSRHSEGR